MHPNHTPYFPENIAEYAPWVAKYGLTAPYGECQCGCGAIVKLACQSLTSEGWTKNHPIRVIQGHSNRVRHFVEDPNPSGLCMCGCGEKTAIAPHTSRRLGMVEGKPRKFLSGHNRAPANQSLEERFRQRCPKGEPDQCWIWRGRVRGKYGEMRYFRKQYATHRLAYELHYGPIPDDLWVLHKCDHPACCNPAHLFLGTPQANVEDMVDKDRQARGEKQHSAKLTESDVIEIRNLRKQGMTFAVLSKRFGISAATAHRAATYQTWKHVP